MEDDLKKIKNRRRPQTKMEDNLKQKMEDDLKKKMTGEKWKIHQKK
jgi:hypothetical protein